MIFDKTSFNWYLDSLIIGLETVSTDTLLTTPIGKFHCYYYKSYTTKLDGTLKDVEFPNLQYWISPNFGPIRQESTIEDAGTGFQYIVWELVSIELK